MVWQVPRIWERGDVWIIGGGPSLIREFQIADDVAQSVIMKKQPLSFYSQYMECIHKKHVIGINVAYQIGTWVDIVFFGDNNFFKAHLTNLYQFPNLKVSCAQHTKQYEWVKYVEKDPSHLFGISEYQTAVSWNKNSGAAAISVAVHMGAKRIFLLGFDMQLSDTETQHWHSVYYNEGKPRNKRKLPFERHLKGFPAIAQDAKMIGVEIINVNPTSAINEFSKVTLKEALML